MFDTLTRDEQFALQDLIIDCMGSASRACIRLAAEKRWAEQNAVYDLDTELCELFNMLNPLAVS